MAKSKPSELPVIGVGPAGGHLTRREMVRRLLVGMSAGAAWPLAAGTHPIFAHFTNDAILLRSDMLAANDWKPIFLSAPQNETLVALAEAIVPGSTRADANRFIDLLLSADKSEHQKQFIESLAAFDAEAQKRFGKGFSALDDGQRNSLLTDASQKPARANGSQSNGAGETHALYDHFENVKGWVGGAYYSSEAGMRELGWTGDYAFDKFPGCEHPEGHH